MTNPLVGHVILSQDYVLVYHVISKLSRCHVIKHMTGQVIVSQGHMLVYHMISKLSRCHVIKHMTDQVIVSQGHMVKERILPHDYTLA